MQIPLFQIDAFAGRVFAGNPAAVCPLEGWLPDATMQAIAAENNLSETAFFVGEGDSLALRWFTPRVEIDLCGHATIAAAHVWFSEYDRGAREVTFDTASGTVRVERDGDLLVLDFPSRPAEACDAPDGLADALGVTPVEVYAGERDYMVVTAGRDDVRAARPDPVALEVIDRIGFIVTGPDGDADFVSRFFAPAAGVPEDPVCGSAHCTLAPYWAKRLEKTHLYARQESARGGELFCELRGDRVRIGGRSVCFLQGTINI